MTVVRAWKTAYKKLKDACESVEGTKLKMTWIDDMEHCVCLRVSYFLCLKVYKLSRTD